jgi:predicted FMN-binding regulatory protein PaiB
VPTWNFAVVQATGKLRPVTEPKALHAFLARLIRKFESYQRLLEKPGESADTLIELYVRSGRR